MEKKRDKNHSSQLHSPAATKSTRSILGSDGSNCKSDALSPNQQQQQQHNQAAKNIIIPTATTPIRLEWWSYDNHVKNTADSNSTHASTIKNNVKPTSRSTLIHRSVRSQPTYTSKVSSSNSIVVYQSDAEETWPGGAIWDISWCIAQLLIGIFNHEKHLPTRNNSRHLSIKKASTSTITTPTVLSKTTLYQDDTLGTVLHEQENHIELPQRLIDVVPLLFSNSEDELSDTQQHESNPTSVNRSKNNDNNQHTFVLELGCGVGLTGLVCSAAASKNSNVTVILTDLSIVVERITKPNVLHNCYKTIQKTEFPFVFESKNNGSDGDCDNENNNPTKEVQAKNELVREEINATSSMQCSKEQYVPLQIHTIKQKSSSNQSNTNSCVIGQRVITTPLCWGSRRDELMVQAMIRHLQQQTYNDSAKKYSSRSCCTGIPDWLIIGDVAYQHKPGAASHFDALIQTMLYFSNETTILIFGLRIRMAASIDLYHMILQHYDNIFDVPIQPQEIDPIQFQHVKPNTMSIHFMKKRLFQCKVV